MILSGNSIEHAVINFAAMSLGVVVAPVSPNYTLMPGGLTRLREIADLLRPTLVFAQSDKDYAAARTLRFAGDGFYRVGDTVDFLDDSKAQLGLRFTGRLSENYKLANGTWVVVGSLRGARMDQYGACQATHF